MAVPFVSVRQKNMCSMAQIREQRGSLRGSAVTEPQREKARLKYNKPPSKSLDTSMTFLTS